MSEPNAGGAIDMAGAENLSAEDSPSLESNPGADNAADDVKSRAEDVNADEDTDKDEPLHKNPRFKEVIRQNREMRKKLADLESSKGKEPTKEPEKSESSKPNTDFYDRMFEGSPEFEFRPAKEYKDIGDLYKDFRRAFLADTDYLRKSDESARSKATAEFESQLTAIKEDLGDDDAFNDFATFLEQVVQKHHTADVDMVFDLWLERYEGGKPEDEKSKDQPRKPSKVNKSNKPPIAKGKKPSYDYIRNKSMDDIIADLT